MPSGRDIIVERVYEGYRREEFVTRVPPGHRYMVLEADDHVHLVIGTDEELEGIGLVPSEMTVSVTVSEDAGFKAEDLPKPKRKPAAKKPAAKKG